MNAQTTQIGPPYKRLTESESAQLDSVRGASALVVAIAHANQTIIAPMHAGASLALGFAAQASVMVFFVLSGFLIGKSINGNLNRHNGRFAIGQYAIDRVLRIWPPLLLALLLIVAMQHLSPFVFPSGSSSFLQSPGESPARTGLTYTASEILGAALGLNGYLTDTPTANGPLWSLSIEIWYYALAAIVALPRGWWRLLAVPVAAGLMQLAQNNSQFFYYLPVWAAGYVVAILHDRRIFPSLSIILIAIAGCLTAAAWNGYQSSTIIDGKLSWLALVRFNVFFGFAACWLLMLLLQGRLRISTAARSSAAYAYTLYVIHFPLLLFIYGVFQPWINRGMVQSIAIAAGSVLVIVVLSRTLSRVVENKRLLQRLLQIRPAPVANQ